MDDFAQSINASKALHLLKLRDVKLKTSLSSATIYKKMKEGSFPRSRRLTSACVRWLSTDIDEWMAALPIQEQDI